MLSYIAWFLLRLIYIVFRPFKVEGEENLPESGTPVIVVANHVHELDPWKIGPLLPFGNQVYWLAKKESFEFSTTYWDYRQQGFNFFFSWLLATLTIILVRYSLTVPVDREDIKSRTNIATFKKILRLIKQEKKTVGIFGRGGIGPEYEDKAQPIFVKLAESCKVAILPVKLEDGRLVFGPKFLVASVADAQSTAHHIMNNIDRF